MRRREFIKAIFGLAVAIPFAARAQQPDRIRHIGYLNVGAESDPEIQTLTRELTQRLQELGWSSGRNVLIDFRFGGSDPMQISRLAAELVEGHPDLIIASGTAGAAALRQQSLSIPIVFVQVVDPVLAGFVTNLARPEGNITGFTNFEFSVGGKWLQLLKEYAPATSRIAAVFDPANPSWAAYLRTIEATAPSFGVQLTPAPCAMLPKSNNVLQYLHASRMARLSCFQALLQSSTANRSFPRLQNNGCPRYIRIISSPSMGALCRMGHPCSTFTGVQRHTPIEF